LIASRAAFASQPAKRRFPTATPLLPLIRFHASQRCCQPLSASRDSSRQRFSR